MSASGQPANTAIEIEFATMLREQSGFELAELDRSATFLELGFDSLFMIQLCSHIQNRFKTKVTFRQLIEEIPTVNALLAHLDKNSPLAQLPSEEKSRNEAGESPTRSTKPPQITNAVVESKPGPVSAPIGASSPVGSTSAIEQIILQQNALMAAQLDLIQGRRTAAVMPSSSESSSESIAENQPNTHFAGTTAAPQNVDSAEGCETHSCADSQPNAAIPESVVSEETSIEQQRRERFGPYKPIRRTSQSLSDSQREHLNEFVSRYTRRTAQSRTHSETHRDYFADPRSVASYRRIWKSLVYQIVVDRSKGSKLWDTDGNDYVDIAMGFGLNLFGHSPDFVTEALHKQLDRGVEVGPQSPLAGEVAQLLADFSRMERVTFCNTGSEAVMAALRLARTVTGKSKFVFFNKDYHGNFDQVLLRSNRNGAKRRTTPAAPGVPQEYADTAIVLDYGTSEAIETITEHADEIAAVLVEPVQSGDIFVQPKEFLHEVRRVTRSHDIAMIMDEVITGFRAAPGGAQEYFDVWGDMATYGKILGGGMPFGALAGNRRFMDGLDGGTWRYDDASEPDADMTFFAGTFVRHPLGLAAAHQILMRLKEEGPELQRRLTDKTTQLVETLNQFFESEKYPIRVGQFTSQFRFVFPQDIEFADMLYFHLLDRGVFTRGWGDNCFLSTAHTDEDIQRVIDAVIDSCREIRSGGFLPDADNVDVVMSDSNGPNNRTKRPEPIGTPSACVEKKKPHRFPLTEAQLEIWLTSQMSDEASCSFNVPVKVCFHGPLDVERLCHALQTVIARHDAFHVMFDSDGLHQELQPRRPVQIERDDLTQISSQHQANTMASIVESLGATPFDLTSGPLIRLRLVKLADDEHILFHSAHHIVSDGWSVNLILEETAAVYAALLEGHEADLSEPAGFHEYVAMELDTDNNNANDALDYWRNVFGDIPNPLELPYDRPRPTVKTYTGNTLVHNFDSATYQSIKQTAAKNGASLFSMTLAVFKILLARLSGQDDIVVTIPSAGQTLMDNPCLVGHCVNLLPIRSVIDLSQPFNSLLAQTQSRVLDAYDHQQCTLGKIVRNLQIPRDSSRMPLVEVNFNLDRDGAGLNFQNLNVEVSQCEVEACTFDLFFSLNETNDGLELYLDYNRNLFDESTMRRWVAHYERLLEAIASEPSSPIEKLPLLSEDQQRQILVDWNATAADYPRDKTVHQLFEQQVRQTPDAIAVVAGANRFTYRHVNHRANQLARHLRGMGIGPEQFVGIYLERSEQMVIAALGILKAGATYVPLDPMFPVDRLTMMADDAKLSAVVTQESLSSQSIAPDAATICIDRDWATIEHLDATDPDESIDTQRLAYVIYTSGSTGKPKGVQIPHRALTNFLCAMQNAPGIKCTDVLASVTTLSFDIAALEIYLPLVCGASVVIVSVDETIDGRKLSRRLENEAITIMQATPATWRLLIDSEWSGKQDLKILCGGEAMPRDLADSLLTRCQSLWNMYGPTETTIWSTICEIRPGDEITIGRPIANTQVYILDDKQLPVPPGVIGRLYIGGDGLARGYLKRPELTAEKFVCHPFLTDGNQLIYDTGDQARYRADGRIEFLGRRDHQVKIRGFRIELDEIEHALSQQSNIDQAVVVARNDVGGVTSTEQSLVAYLIASGELPSATELRKSLGKTLPDYMIPSAFVTLDRFPLTPNQKVDRKALPTPEIDRQQLSADFRAPRDQVELQVANVWKKNLNVRDLGLDDNFFDAGGHSLAAARMIVDMEKLYGERLPLATLLHAPTIRQFAGVIKNKDWKPAWRSLVPIKEGGSKPPFFFIHAAFGNILLYRDLAKHLGPDQPVYGLQAKGLNGDEPVHTTVEAMAKDYVEEIRKIQPTGPYHIGGYCLGGTIAYEVAQQLVDIDEEVGVLALFDTHSRWFTASTAGWLYTGYQQIAFHAANVLKSGPRGVGAFLREKFREMSRRVSRRTAVTSSKLSHALGFRKSPPLILLEKVNDKASEEYVPQPYPGRLTVFKPCKAYLGYEDPSLGWGNGLVDDIDVIELPVFPAGMLLEPFVQELAHHLRRKLDEAERTSENLETGDNHRPTNGRHADALIPTG